MRPGAALLRPSMAAGHPAGCEQCLVAGSNLAFLVFVVVHVLYNMLILWVGRMCEQVVQVGKLPIREMDGCIHNNNSRQ